jgi:Domain of unknown function (DUF4965)/Domain of unknown function (DUF5127)/Domain of unknown function (DUF1793)/Domain of unknown function (DUF4964)
MIRSKLLLRALVVVIVVVSRDVFAQSAPVLRAPAVPLVPVDPYFSIWSAADKLTDADANGNPTIVHWTGSPNQLTSLIRIDGKTFRIMGISPAEAPALPQTAVRILPTTVAYTFEGEGVQVELSFMTPLLPDDLMIFSRPITYLSWQVKATDGKSHDVQLYYDNTAELVVNNVKTEKVTWLKDKFGDVDALRIGSADQPVLRQKGDRIRINWGYDYVAAPTAEGGKFLIAGPEVARKTWDRETAKSDSSEAPVAASDAPVLSVIFDLGKISDRPASRMLMLAYDDVASVQYFGQSLKGYWTKNGDDIGKVLQKAAAEYESLKARCQQFDRELMADLEKAGGPKYAWIGALAYRQSLAASKVVADSSGQPLYFCKENTSNGCMGTVDVFYPQSPLPLLISPSLSKAMLVPVLEYASSPRWTWPNAPHDVGTWPQGNGQVYGGSKSNGGMPVEETGNMLLLVAAVAQADGNADFATRYWPTLAKWAQYLEAFGRDPENQLCTDDFAGHLAHNANLAGKAICALGAFGKLAEMKGDQATAQKYTTMAKEYALGWIKQADDGDHFRLACDQPNTWSSKYNLVWDKILGLNLFPDEALKKEMAFYRKNVDPFGLALDGRPQRAGGRGSQRTARWSKTDWAFWTACLTGDPQDFEAITNPIYDYFSQTPRRVGLSDLYFTDRPTEANMHSRPVIGGIFIKMLYDPATWRKWNSRDLTKARGPWAPLPQSPKTAEVVSPASIAWKYTTTRPAENWNQRDFDDSSWKEGKGGFGTAGTPGAHINTVWNTPDIWLRGEVTIPNEKFHNLQLSVYHDEDAEVFIDGNRVARLQGYDTDYVSVAVDNPAGLKPGKHFVAVHCHQTTGGQAIDLGMVDVIPVETTAKKTN